jgi:ABC-2 type transport system ATP-binding protein
LRQLRDQFGVTIVMTTHLLEEAEKADRIGILHEGELVALDRPDALRSSVGTDSLTIQTDQPDELAAAINARFDCRSQVVDGSVRLEQSDAGAWVARLMDAFPDSIATITVGKPTLEDVFIQKTGHRFWQNRLGE